MLTRIIPCLDCRDGRVVKGIRFGNLRDVGSPAALAAAYESQGADEIMLLDIAATPGGRRHQIETVRSVRESLSIPLSVGGGVRGADDASRLLDEGADKIAVNSAAVRDPQLLGELARRFGSQCTVLAVDAALREEADWEVVVLSGQERTGIDALQWCREAVDRGAGEILLTSWDRDGTRSGYDLALVQQVSRAVKVPVIASGGANTPEHLADAIAAGADAVLAASIFHDRNFTVQQVKHHLRSRQIEVRP
jgi:imidazoleglycerol phosphate synthase cyclase subunit